MPASDSAPRRAGRPVIGITLGDAAGIGPEVTAAALNSGLLDPAFEYRIIGSCPDALPGQPDKTSALAAIAALEESVRLFKIRGNRGGGDLADQQGFAGGTWV